MGVTEMAGGAFVRQDYTGVFIPGIHGKHFGRAELHADAAAFAPDGIDENRAARTFFGRNGRGGLILWNNVRHELPFELSVVEASFYQEMYAS